jgi:hypothetical protein
MFCQQSADSYRLSHFYVEVNASHSTARLVRYNVIVTPGLITCINVKEMSQDGGLQKERRWRTLPDTCCSWTRVSRPGTVLSEVLLSGRVLGDDAGPTG